MVIVYLPNKGKIADKLEKVCRGSVPKTLLEIHRSRHLLQLRLQEKTGDVTVVILLNTDRKELSDLLYVRNLLTDLRTIIILPDKGNDSITKGHVFYPNFISYADSDFNDIADVMKKIIKSRESSFELNH